MRSLRVLDPGLMTTVQDLGRPGYGLLGISPSGAADPVSLRLANRVLQNPLTTAGLEMTLLGGTFQFTADAVFSFAGAPMAATLDGQSVEPVRAYPARAGQILKFQVAPRETRTYLCIQGGFDIPLFLGSYSTHTMSRLGGWQGRPLQAGDELPLGEVGTAASGKEASGPATSGPAASGPASRLRLRPGILEQLSPRKKLRVLMGPDQNLFSQGTCEKFLNSTFRVSEYSNRLGIRLEGSVGGDFPNGTNGSDRLPAEGLSQGVALGTVQISPDGQPTILFVEQQTTGGYPQMACVISADHYCLGQLRPGDMVSFEETTLEEALASLKALERLLTAEDLLIARP